MFIDGREVIFQTVHGSRLYGLSHSGSDNDRYIVTTGDYRPRHDVTGESDTVMVGFPRFLRYAQMGSHQSVEALFSPLKGWHSRRDQIEPHLLQMRIGGPVVAAKYERTIHAFCHGDFKRRRHAARLSFNLADLRRYGRFSPIMLQDDIQLATELATQLEGDDLWHALLDMTRATSI